MISSKTVLIPDVLIPVLICLSLVWLALAVTTHLVYRRLSGELYLKYWTVASYLAFVAVGAFAFAAAVDRATQPQAVRVMWAIASLAGYVQPSYLLLSALAMQRKPVGRSAFLLVAGYGMLGLALLAGSIHWEWSREEIYRYVFAPRSLLTALSSYYFAFVFLRHSRTPFDGFLRKTICPLFLVQGTHQLLTAAQQLTAGSWYVSASSVAGALIPVVLGISIVLGLLFGLTEEAKSANSAKTAFLATMSHEMRTPLAGLVGLSTILAKSNLDLEQREAVRSMDQCAQSMLAMIDEILDLTRIDTGLIAAKPAPLDPRALIGEVILMMQPMAASTGVALSANLDANLPPFVESDPRMIRQILLNLLGNALKFTSEGSITVAAAYEASGIPPQLTVTVTDTGCGIAAKDLPHLADPFYQGGNLKYSASRGVGLGLHLCQRWLAILGGTGLQVRSEEGAGSEFSFVIPAPAVATPASVPLPAQPAAPVRTVEILVVEDNKINQKVLIRLLESLGHTVRLAPDGAAAVEQHRQKAPDLILMDVMMPVMDGVEAARLIRASEETATHVPIVALTASTLDSERDRCLGAGMDDFVTKPVSLDTLAAVVARWSHAGAPHAPAGSA